MSANADIVKLILLILILLFLFTQKVMLTMNVWEKLTKIKLLKTNLLNLIG